MQLTRVGTRRPPWTATSTGQRTSFIAVFQHSSYVGIKTNAGCQSSSVTSPDAEYIHYFDASKAVLDTRPISQAYGTRSLYGACQNAESADAVERKLSELESRVAPIIDELHAVLPGRVFTLKRAALQDLRKFLFVFPLRHVLANDGIPAGPALLPMQPWIDYCTQTQTSGFNSRDEALLHLLQHHLDTPHARLLAEGNVALLEPAPEIAFLRMKYGGNFPREAIDMYPLAYAIDASKFFPCIWEAAEGEEFVLTNRSFGLWEGVYDDASFAHRIFVISPSLAIVLRLENPLDELTRPTRPLFSSRLVDIEQESPAFLYGAVLLPGNAWFPGEEHCTSEEDILALDIKKLTSTETWLVNEVLLSSVHNDGAVTFTSKPCMLQTGRMFCGDPARARTHRRILDLTWKLETVPMELDHPRLSKLLLDISTGKRKFRSAYDRVRAIIDCVLCKTLFPSVFMSAVLVRTRNVLKRFTHDCSRAVPCPVHPWVNTLPADISTSLFSFLYEVMGHYGFVRRRTGNVRDIIEDEVVALEFLRELAWSSQGWYKLMTCDPKAASILSKLFDSENPSDTEIVRAIETANVRAAYTGYGNTFTLHHAVCLSGPTKNPMTQHCTASIATITRQLATIIPKTGRSERPGARLVAQLPPAQWAELVGVLKGLMRSAGLRLLPWGGGLEPTIQARLANDIVIIGVLGWMAKQRADALEEFCRAREIALVETDDG
ncbi:hypothetical protein ID866_7783 [Astraeus odoratus]|nr:hypothetical protein ID866_7783 [Astraeus odoratus]